LTTHGGRLPAETSRFFGRADEFAAVQHALARSRLVTLAGPGGIGKTRLAVKVAAANAHAFADGVFLADVSAARDCDAVTRSVAAALGLPAQRGGHEPGRLAGQLGGRRLLLILDTCEQAVDACAALADAILSGGVGPVLMVASRQPLGLPGEVVCRVPPLAECEAVSLFIDRAGAAEPGFAVSAGTLPKITRLGQLLDGVPLAVELAALRMRAVGLDELLARLPGRLRLLGYGRPAAGGRQQSLQASISWSYDLCSPAERLLWNRLSVFGAGFDLAAAEDACSGGELAADEILGTLAGLVDKSIVLRAADASGTARYRLPAIVREQGAAMSAAAAISGAVPRQATSARHRLGPARQALAAPRLPAGSRPPAGRWPAGADRDGREARDDAAYEGCWALLTAREREVAALVAMGLTSKDIATRLVVSKRTVDSHLEHILGKLGYNSRVQVAALASYELAREQREGTARGAPDGEASRSG
jgi:non-specific serine/threonine protein kinase